MLALGITLVPAFAQQTEAEAPLVANAELDSYAIAEQLYTQARNTPDAAARAQAMGRAANLFANYVSKFPKGANREKAMYLQAVCQAEAGTGLHPFSGKCPMHGLQNRRVQLVRTALIP